MVEKEGMAFGYQSQLPLQVCACVLFVLKEFACLFIFMGSKLGTCL